MALCPCCPSNSSNNLAGVATGASAMPVPSSTRCPAGPLLQPSPSPRRPRRQVPRPAGAFSSLARPSPRAPLVAHELRDPDGHFVSLVAAVDSQASTLPPPADALRHPGGVEHRVVVLGRCRLPLFFTGSGITSPDPLPPPTSIHQATPASLRPPPGTGTRRAQLRPRRRAPPCPSHRAAPVQPLLELVVPCASSSSCRNPKSASAPRQLLRPCFVSLREEQRASAKPLLR
nr:uncharacterized protein LOC120973813 isoform X1 [Aegilops tauschii subsp. strangulata]